MADKSKYPEHGHEVWEIGIIIDGVEHLWHPAVFNLRGADPTALNIGKFHSRHLGARANPEDDRWIHRGWHNGSTNCGTSTMPANPTIARQVCELLAGRRIVGACPDFDVRHLAKFAFDNGEKLTAHYQPIDVEVLAAGYIAGSPDYLDDLVAWELHLADIARAFEVPFLESDQHTALGDARVARAIFERIMGDLNG